MKKRLSILLLIFSFGCHQEATQEPIEDYYTAGIPIDHAKEHLTTMQSFDSFNLHTWMHDTMYLHCAYELQLEPNDSTLEYTVTPQGAKIYYSSNKYRFALEPVDSIVTVTLVLNGMDTVVKEFISPNLPPPTLVKEETGDSVKFSLIQKNKRLREILPKDCRYVFQAEGGSKQAIIVAKREVDGIRLNAIRLNYMNESYPVQIKNE